MRRETPDVRTPGPERARRSAGCRQPDPGARRDAAPVERRSADPTSEAAEAGAPKRRRRGWGHRRSRGPVRRHPRPRRRPPPQEPGRRRAQPPTPGPTSFPTGTWKAGRSIPTWRGGHWSPRAGRRIRRPQAADRRHPTGAAGALVPRGDDGPPRRRRRPHPPPAPPGRPRTAEHAVVGGRQRSRWTITAPTSTTTRSSARRGRAQGAAGRSLSDVRPEPPDATHIAVLEGRSLVEHYVSRPLTTSARSTATSTWAGFRTSCLGWKRGSSTSARRRTRCCTAATPDTTTTARGHEEADHAAHRAHAQGRGR